MCGLGLVLVTSQYQQQEGSNLNEILQRLLKHGWETSDHGEHFAPVSARGPQGVQAVLAGEGRALCVASVLHLRGVGSEQGLQQPIKCGNGVLGWNGQVFGGPGTEGLMDGSVSDTVFISSKLQAAQGEQASASEAALSVLQPLEGPWAFTWVGSNEAVFARDWLGRRSLLVGQPEKGVWIVSSVALPGINCEWTELVPRGIWSLNLTSGDFSCLEWTHGRSSWLNRTPDGLKPEGSTAVDTLRAALEASVGRRVLTAPGHSVSVLYSGGIDSLLLALFVDRVVEPDVPIELVNVAFGENPEATPDRIAGRTGLVDELHRLGRRPPELWKFVAVDIPDVSKVVDTVAPLLIPSDTVMDVNIGTALWAAAGGATTSVLICGQGADEQLGGYARYRTKNNWGGLEAVAGDMKKDLERLWVRNLGRDDRVVSSHGKEARFPFLDEGVMAVVASYSLETLVDFSKPLGEGEKALLRAVARSMGVGPLASSRPKKAIQFGSGIAKRSHRGAKGSDKVNP